MSLSHVTAAPFHVVTVLFQFHTAVTFQYHSNLVPMSQQPISNTTTVLFPCHNRPIPIPQQSCSHVTAAMLFFWKASNRVFIFVLRVPGFLDSDEAPLLERLIEAYREKDSDALEQCCNDAVFRSMDTEVRTQPYNLPFSLFPRISQHAVNLGNYKLPFGGHIYSFLACSNKKSV